MNKLKLAILAIVLGAIAAIVYFVFFNKSDAVPTSSSANLNSKTGTSGSSSSGTGASAMPLFGSWIGLYRYPSPSVGGFSLVSQAGTIASMLGGSLATYDQVKASKIGFAKTSAGILSGGADPAATMDGIVCAYAENSNCNKDGQAVNSGFEGGNNSLSESMNMFVIFTDSAWKKLPSLNSKDSSMTKESISAMMQNGVYFDGGPPIQQPSKVDPNKKWMTLYFYGSPIHQSDAAVIASALQGTLANYDQIGKSGIYSSNLSDGNPYFKHVALGGKGESAWGSNILLLPSTSNPFASELVPSGYDDTYTARFLYVMFDDATWQKYLLNPSLQNISTLNNGRFNIMAKSAVSFVP